MLAERYFLYLNFPSLLYPLLHILFLRVAVSPEPFAFQGFNKVSPPPRRRCHAEGFARWSVRCPFPPTDGRPRASSVWLACEGENVNIAMKTHPFPCVKNVRCAHFFDSLLVAKKLCGVPARKAIVLLQNVMDPFSFLYLPWRSVLRADRMVRHN